MSDRSRRATLIAVFLSGVFGIAAADELPVRDPTRPPFPAGEGGVPKTQETGMQLVSTAVSRNGRSAVINDDVVTVGSYVGGAVVTAIEQGRVTLKRGDDTIVLQLFTPPVKRPARESS